MNLEVEPAPRNQNHQRRPRRKKCEKTTGAKKPKPKTDDAVDESENREKETGSEETPESESKIGLHRPRKPRKRLQKMMMMTGWMTL